MSIGGTVRIETTVPSLAPAAIVQHPTEKPCFLESFMQVVSVER